MQVLAYAANSTVNVAALKKQAPKRKQMTKRAFALETLLKYEHLLESVGHKVFRKTCIDAILANFPGTSLGSVGAIYNDAKHLLINEGIMAEFGRHGMGRNKHSKKPVEQPEQPKAYEVPEGHKWVLINKETRKIEGSAESKNKASKQKLDNQTIQKYAEAA